MKGFLTVLKIKNVSFIVLIIIYADNQKIIKLVINSIFQNRIKHVVVKYHYIENLIDQNEINLKYVSINEMTTNEFIKFFSITKFNKFIQILEIKKTANQWTIEWECWNMMQLVNVYLNIRDNTNISFH